MQLTHDITAEPIEGFRIFTVDVNKLRLAALTSNKMLVEPGENHSLCRLAGGHEIHEPTPKCSCGFYVVKSRRGIHLAYPGMARSVMCGPDNYGMFFRPGAKDTSYASARVRIWGRIIEHENGYRAEWMEVLGQSIQWWPRRAYKHNNKLLHRLREIYSQEGSQLWLPSVSQ